MSPKNIFTTFLVAWGLTIGGSVWLSHYQHANLMDQVKAGTARIIDKPKPNEMLIQIQDTCQRVVTTNILKVRTPWWIAYHDIKQASCPTQ